MLRLNPLALPDTPTQIAIQIQPMLRLNYVQCRQTATAKGFIQIQPMLRLNLLKGAIFPQC